MNTGELALPLTWHEVAWKGIPSTPALAPPAVGGRAGLGVMKGGEQALHFAWQHSGTGSDSKGNGELALRV